MTSFDPWGPKVERILRPPRDPTRPRLKRFFCKNASRHWRVSIRIVICKRIDTKTNQYVLPTTLFMILPVLERENWDSTSFSSTPDPLFSWKWSSNVISEFEKFSYRTPQKNWSGYCLTIHPPLDLSWAADSFPRTIQIRPRRRLASTCFCIHEEEVKKDRRQSSRLKWKRPP